MRQVVLNSNSRDVLEVTMKPVYEISVPVYTPDDVFKTLVIMNQSGCIMKDYRLNDILDLFRIEYYSLQLREDVTKVTVAVESSRAVDKFREEYHRVYPIRTISIVETNVITKRRRRRCERT